MSVQRDERRMRGPQNRISDRSPSDGSGQWIYVASGEARSVEVKQRATWGEESLPPLRTGRIKATDELLASLTSRSVMRSTSPSK